MQRLLTMDPRRLPTILRLLRELCLGPVLRQPLPDNVRPDFTGCPPQQVKLVGVWRMEEHTLEEDMVAMPPMAIPIILLRQLPEDTIVVVSLGILSGKDVRTALAQVATHGMDRNARHSLPQITLEEATTIITIPAPAILIPVAPLTIQAPLLLPAPIPQADAVRVGLIGVLVPVKAPAVTVPEAALIQAIPARD